MTRQRAGFTLIEILVAIAIFGVVGVLIGQVVFSTSSSARRSVVESELDTDLRLAQALIVDDVRRASYVFPQNSSIRISATLPSVDGAWTKNPITGTSVFPIAPTSGGVGQDSWIATAFLIPDSTGCVFRMYYLAERDDIVAVADEMNNPGVNTSATADAWILLRYSLPATGTICNGYRVTVAKGDPVLLTGGRVDLVADNIVPSNGAAVYVPFTLSGSNNNVVVRLRASKMARTRVVFSPRSGELVTSASTRNTK